MKKSRVVFLLITFVLVAGLAFWGGRASLQRPSASAPAANSTMAGMNMKSGAKAKGKASPGKAETGSHGKGKILYWRAPMNPSYISNKPGKSPMGMDLVPVYANEAAAGAVRISPTVIQDIGVTTVKVTEAPLFRNIRTYGVATWDETTLAAINPKIGGWIQKLYVNRTGQEVQKGQPLLSIYSEQLVAAQQEYLSALNSIKALGKSRYSALSRSGRQMLEAARQRLKLWDISDAQIKELARTHHVRTTLTLYAPISGIVTHRQVVLGDHIKAGQNLMQIANLNPIWILASAYQSDIPYLKAGMKATVHFDDLPGETFQGTIDYVYPYIQGKSRTSQVRIRLPNPDGKILPQMYATVKLRVPVAAQAVQVPNQAVIRSSATDNVVFVERAPGRFTGRKVVVGPEGENHMVMIRAGLKPGEKVVTSGQFLIDSQANLNTAIQEMLSHKKKEASK